MDKRIDVIPGFFLIICLGIDINIIALSEWKLGITIVDDFQLRIENFNAVWICPHLKKLILILNLNKIRALIVL